MDGWIKIYRKLSDWEWYSNSYMVHLFLHLLLTANVADRKWKGIDIKRGQLVTSIRGLSDTLGIPVQSVRTCLNRLVATNEITVLATQYYTLITVCNFESYQSQIVCYQQTTNTPNNTLINTGSNTAPTQSNYTDNQEFIDEETGEVTHVVTQVVTNELTTPKEEYIYNNIISGKLFDSEKPKNKKQKIEKELPLWKTDFNVYLKDAQRGFNEALVDKKLKSDFEYFYANINIEKSLDKMWIEFWGTELGWEHKRKTKTQKIDWLRTIRTSLANPMNRLYLTKEEREELNK